jgi:hypothetical protein
VDNPGVERRGGNAVARLSTSVGVILIVLGVAAYLATGMASLTALIPAVLGLLLYGSGWAASRSPRLRTPALIFTTLVATAGVLGSLRGVPDAVALLSGSSVERPLATVAQVLTVVLCLVLLTFIVRWLAGRRWEAS